MENDEWDRDWCECEERERVATLRRVPTCRTWRARVVLRGEATRRATLEAWRGVQRAGGPDVQTSRCRRSRHGSPEARDSKSRRASEGRRRPLSGRGGASGASGGSGGRRGGQRDLSTVSGGGGEGSTQGHFRRRPRRNSRNMEQAGQWRIVTIFEGAAEGGAGLRRSMGWRSMEGLGVLGLAGPPQAPSSPVKAAPCKPSMASTQAPQLAPWHWALGTWHSAACTSGPWSR